MTETLADTGLPLTDDGWTCEVLDVDDQCRWHNEVGGDIQIGNAPSYRLRFVSPEGAVVVITQHAYVVAEVSEPDDMLRLGFDPDDELTESDVDSIQIAVSAWNDALTEGDGLDSMIDPLRYGWNVVTEVDHWEPGNLVEAWPNREEHGLPEDREEGGYVWSATPEAAREEASGWVRMSAGDAALGWYPSNF